MYACILKQSVTMEHMDITANNCSFHCLHDYMCDKQTGHCHGGCDPGYTNSDCKKGKTIDHKHVHFVINEHVHFVINE